MKTIGIVGTGIMGSGMARNYLKAGYKVNIWNRSPGKAKDLVEAGAKTMTTPRAVSEASDIIFEVTANDQSSQAVWQGKDGILAGASAQKVLIASATLSVDWTLELARLCHGNGFTFFDMPLTGGRAAAEGGFLTLLVGGDETKLKTLKPDLDAISSKVFYFGPAASGMKYKLVLNSLQATHLAAFGEAMKLAVAAGLKPEKVGPALVDRPGGAVTTISWDAYQKPVPPLTFSVNWITKDLEYAQKITGADTPIFNDVLKAFHEMQQRGKGDSDWTIVNKD